MLTLTCPYCGIKAEETELAPGGEAHLKRYGPGSTDAEFEAYLFARKNPKGVHFERWRHSYGCGKWFLAARDTARFTLSPRRIDLAPGDLLALPGERLPHRILRESSHRILNQVRGVNRVLYDVSTKPPASIEWE